MIGDRVNGKIVPGSFGTGLVGKLQESNHIQVSPIALIGATAFRMLRYATSDHAYVHVPAKRFAGLGKPPPSSPESRSDMITAAPSSSSDAMSKPARSREEDVEPRT